ncbi:uncharacterized protein [Nicotiana sylvestris]|uniref:uncharacterized protein n=1 Tax=Nicotiana sylvestris TaxID=4096 RepID=UPI00388C7EFA
MSKAGFDRHTGPVEAPLLSECNFKIDVSDNVSAIGKIKDTRWPKPILSDPSQRNPNLVCKYHDTHGHRTEDCRQLREEVAQLISKGHLRDFLSDRAKNQPLGKRGEWEERTRRTTTRYPHDHWRGRCPQGPVVKQTKISITREKRTQSYIPEDALTFNEEDIETLSQPQNDALVISFLLNKFQIKYVLVDLGSSANIIRLRVVEQLELLDQIVPTSRVLNGFNMTSETMKGEVILLVNVAGTIQDTKFHVIKGDMRYNALLGRPWIHSMRALPSTLHQMMKFPTKDGAKAVYGEQHTAREMFVVYDVALASMPSILKKPKYKQMAK